MRNLEELRDAIREAAFYQIERDQVEGVIDLFRKLIREELMGQKELRERLGKNASAVSMQVWRGHGPPIVGQLAIGRIWFRPDVEEWIRENPKAVRHDSVQEAS